MTGRLLRRRARPRRPRADHPQGGPADRVGRRDRLPRRRRQAVQRAADRRRPDPGRRGRGGAALPGHHRAPPTTRAGTPARWRSSTRSRAARLAAHLEAGRDRRAAGRGRPAVLRLVHVHARPARRALPDRGRARACRRSPPRPRRSPSPLVRQTDVLTVLPGTLPEPELARRLADTDGAIIMKLGRTFPAVRSRAASRPAGSSTRCTSSARRCPSERWLPVADVDPATVPYFSLIVVPGDSRTAGGRADDCGRDQRSAASSSTGAAAELLVVGLGPGPGRVGHPRGDGGAGRGRPRRRLRAVRQPGAAARRA